MATKKQRKGVRADRRRKPAARVRGAKRRPVRARVAVRVKNKAAAPARSAKPRAGARGATRPAAKVTPGRELAALKREKNALEKQLTETVREIGQLRHHEARAAQFERQLKERDETIAQLRSQLSERRDRAYAPPDDEVQPSLALGSRTPRDLDDLEDDLAPDDEDDELI